MLEMLEAARVAALEGARVIRESGCEGRSARTKSSEVDFVTQTDVASGVTVVGMLAAKYPEARFVVEEHEVFDAVNATPGDLTDSEVWVIDPLDGTTSFLHGYPFYSVSIALLQEGEPVLGVVHNVPSGETFTAARGLGVTLDDEPIRCSRARTVQESLLLTGFPYDRGRTLERQLAVFSAFMRSVHGIRRDGSAALDCCSVASGRADGFWEFGLAPWDTAAGVVILEEAGAKVTDFEDRPWTVETRNVLAANPMLHERMLEVVQATDPGPEG